MLGVTLVPQPQKYCSSVIGRTPSSYNAARRETPCDCCSISWRRIYYVPVRMCGSAASLAALPDKHTVLCILLQSGKNDGWSALPKFHAVFSEVTAHLVSSCTFARFAVTSKTYRPKTFQLAKTKYQPHMRWLMTRWTRGLAPLLGPAGISHTAKMVKEEQQAGEEHVWQIWRHLHDFFKPENL